MMKTNFIKGTLIFATTIFLLSFMMTNVFAAVPIKLFPSSHHGAISVDIGKIKQILTHEFQLDAEDTTFSRVDAKIVYDADDQPDYLIVHLMDKYTYSFEIAKVDLINGYTVIDVQTDYHITEADLLQDAAGEKTAVCPDNSVQMVFATCETSVNTAVDAVNTAASTAQTAGFKTKKLLGSEESRQAYKDWLSCNNLLLFGRVGHGTSSAIQVADGALFDKDFQNMNLNGKVLYFNSCQVHNDPLEGAIIGAGVKRFIGGNIDLWMGTSEAVFECWMDKVLSQKKAMTSSVTDCENETNYPDKGAHGISGNGTDDYINGGGPITQYNLSVSTSGQGSVAFDPPGGKYDAGTSVTVTANPASGWHFSSWSGDLTGSTNPVKITMNSNKRATATFTESGASQYRLNIDTIGQGSVTLDPPGGLYDAGTRVTVTANPSSGWKFSNWSGDLSGSNNPATIAMNADKNATATFNESTSPDKSCAGRCGKSAPSGCWCDNMCEQYGDCCHDKKQHCGY